MARNRTSAISLCNKPDDTKTHGDEEHRLQKLQDANCDEPAIAVWMGMRCQSAVLINPAFKPMIHPGG